MKRREFITLGLFSLAFSQGSIYPSRASAQALPSFETILKGLQVSFDDFQKLSSLSRALINLRYIYQGPNRYENAEWRVQALRAWDLAFAPPVRVSYFEFVQQSIANLEPFPSSDFGQSFVFEILERYEANQAEFANWCSDIGISPESDFFNDLIASQALFAMQYASRNQELVISEGGASFFDSVTWIWPFCGEP